MKPKARRTVLVWLIVSQVLMALSVMAWAAFLVSSWPVLIMTFDAGPSKQAYQFVAAILCYPLLPLIFALVSWLCYGLRQNLAALILTTVPLVAPLIVWRFLLG